MAERPSPSSSPRCCFSWGSPPPTPATPTPPSTWSAPRRRAGHAPACAALDGGAAPCAGRASKAADVLESALADVHEEDDAAKPLLETLVAAGLESATVRRRLGDLFALLEEPRGAPRTDFERFALITHAYVSVVEQADARRANELIHRALAVEEHATTNPSCEQALAGR